MFSFHTSVQSTCRGSRLRYQCDFFFLKRTRSSSLGQRRYEQYMNVARNFCMVQASPLLVKMAVVEQVTHVRCKVMYRCVCARHCAVETDTQQGYRQRAENSQTNLGSCSIQTELMSLSHYSSHAITPYLGNKVSCD